MCWAEVISLQVLVLLHGAEPRGSFMVGSDHLAVRQTNVYDNQGEPLPGNEITVLVTL